MDSPEKRFCGDSVMLNNNQQCQEHDVYKNVFDLGGTYLFSFLICWLLPATLSIGLPLVAVIIDLLFPDWYGGFKRINGKLKI